MDDEGMHALADLELLVARLAQGKDPGGSAGEVDEDLITRDRCDSSLDDLAAPQRPQREYLALGLGEQLRHRLGLALSEGLVVVILVHSGGHPGQRRKGRATLTLG